ncbi:rRNA maturation RNase YbeY [Candidatus Karelsulcia muelleri]|uniref:rRNA maturation RNase YbeY n=1 Tax=Candidatus Karelsulcia muelleri TaxID=336810 RepID=UPI000D7CE6E8|nr:rRNA maturation RNase YbeY [Candidatus Karelsulcia muelleri]
MINFIYETKFNLYNEILFSKLLGFLFKKEKKKIKKINYIFCEDKFLIKINKKFLKQNSYTDVLTFKYSENNIISGEIFISINRIKFNSLKFKNSFYDELKRVIIHAVLHLIGYNDIKKSEKNLMSKKEDFYLFFFKKKNIINKYYV